MEKHVDREAGQAYASHCPLSHWALQEKDILSTGCRKVTSLKVTSLLTHFRRWSENSSGEDGKRSERLFASVVNSSAMVLYSGVHFLNPIHLWSF